MEELELLQGLEDLRALVTIEDTVGWWEKRTDYKLDEKRHPQNLKHEIWEPPEPEKTSNSIPAVGYSIFSRSDANDYVR
jgi:hypothetical protein